MKSLFALFIVLFAVGAGLTSQLPTPSQPSSTAYVLDKDSIKTPLSAEDLVATVIPNETDTFALQLGTYNDLQQAITKAETLALTDPIQIVAYQDTQHIWYTLLAGQFDSHNSAQSAQFAMANRIDGPVFIVRLPSNKPEGQSS